LSALVLAIFVAGPGLRAECLLKCAKAAKPVAQSSCHDEPAHADADADQVAIGGLHGCADAGPAQAAALKPAGTDSASGRVADRIVSGVVTRPAVADRLLHGPPGSAPPAPLLIPLRI
jgi:hypothetical protein